MNMTFQEKYDFDFFLINLLKVEIMDLLNY